MPIATEPVGSIPRPQRLIQAAHDHEAGRTAASDYDAILNESLRDTIAQGHPGRR